MSIGFSCDPQNWTEKRYINTQRTALKIPKNDPTEKAKREEKLQDGLKSAISVPLKLAVTANTLWPTLKELAKVANIACKSDLQVGVKSIETGVWGAYQIISINLKQVKDGEFTSKVQIEIEEELQKAQSCCAEILRILDKRIDDV